ncbi:MAG: hypothetical protein ACI9MR_002575 [Myxococcota bacterium]|jgi:uncharacterized protein with von Willebrand factor type A (vWA) domain
MGETENHAPANVATITSLSRYLHHGIWGEETALTRLIAKVGGAELALLVATCRRRPLRALLTAQAVVRALEESPPSVPVEPESAPTEETTVSPGRRAFAVEAIRVGHAAGEALDLLEETLLSITPWISWHTRGTGLSRVSLDRLETVTALLARRPELKAIAARLGKLEANDRRGRHRERGGRASVVGVHVGGELSDALPSELALLATPETEDLFYARLTERQLLSFELAGEDFGATQTERRAGPVIACVDTSGSMEGEPELVAKAAVLAVARRVLPAGRRLHVVLFGGEGAIETASFHPRRASLDALETLLTASFHGGTDIDGPLSHALTLREQDAGYREADVLLVTDGVCRLGAAVEARIQQARQRTGLEVVSVVVGSMGTDVKRFSDDVWRVPVLSAEQPSALPKGLSTGRRPRFH